MVSHPKFWCPRAHTALISSVARRSIPTAGLMVAMALAALPAAAQYDNSDSSRQTLKWMPRRPVAQAVETPPAVIQTQALTTENEPAVEPAPQIVQQKTTRPPTRVDRKSVV